MKAIIFDFDGVIIDSYEGNYQCQKQKFKRITREDHKKFLEGNIHEVRGPLLKARKLKEDPDINMHLLIRNHFLNEIVIEKDVFNVLKKLKEKYLLFIISSGREENIKEFLQKQEALSLFKEVLGFETHKKKDFKFQILFDKYEITKNDCVFVTDTLGDILEANKLDIKTIAVDFGFHERERLKKGNPFKIVSSFDEIFKIIESKEI
jgi:phosphoglycolate phosphatase